MRSEEVPVLVVGAGPVGLSTAVFLAHWGVHTLVIDKRDPTTAPPRAGVSVRTLELFRSVGLGPAVERIAWRGAPPMRTVFKESAFGATQHRGGLPRQYEERLTTCGPIDPRLQLTQVEVQRLALEYLADTDSAVRFGVRLLDFDAGETGVRVRTTAGEITARYLIGADGANSELRAMMFYGYQNEYDDVLTDVVQPGCRFPHRWVAPNVSTLDLVGTQWTVLTGDEQWLAAAAEVGIQSAHKLDGGLPGLGPNGAALVRPDGFVAWCTPNREPATVLRDALTRARN